jgi:cbb3-type cytochrome oxidase subunit 3
MGQILHGMSADGGAWILGLTTLSFMLFFIGFTLWMLPAARNADFNEAASLPLDET